MLTPLPVRLYAQLLIGVDFKTPGALQRLLGMFTSSPVLAPTHWATRGGPRDPYSDKDVQQAVAKAGDDGIVPRLIRTLPPLTYSAEWFQSPDGPFLATITVESGDELDGDLAKIFVNLVDSLAASFPLEWGHIDVRQHQQDPSTYIKASGTYDHAGYYQRVGPLTVFPLTYFGKRLLKLAPGLLNLLGQKGYPLKKIGQGGIRLDLLPEPWRQEAHRLKDSQICLLQALEPTGIFARQAATRDFPGPAWLSPAAEDYVKS